MPFPSVANDPAGDNEPSALRSNAMTAFPAAELLSVNTAPTAVPDPPRDSAASVGTAPLGDVTSREHAASVVARKAIRDSLSMRVPPVER